MPELAAERLEATDLIAFVIRPWPLDGGGVARRPLGRLHCRWCWRDRWARVRYR